jgi:PAS domain S-box-containing protein
MTPTKILIVEQDIPTVERLIAKLYRRGYMVCGVAASGEAAVEKAAIEKPDLVLVEIALKGDMDGVETAERIRSETGAPVVFLASRLDGRTMERAKIAEPHGFVFKPFDERELYTAVDLALHRAESERKIKESEFKFRTIADFSPDWIFWFGPDGRFLYNSPSCRTICGFDRKDFEKNPLLFFEIILPEDRRRVESKFETARKSSSFFEEYYRIETAAGQIKRIGQNCAPIFSLAGEWMGIRGANRDITGWKKP